MNAPMNPMQGIGQQMPMMPGAGQQMPMGGPMGNLMSLAQQVPSFRAQMEQQGITDARAEVMRRIQGRMVPPPVMQQIQAAAKFMGLRL